MENVPPPITPSAPPFPQRNWWTWVVFAFLASLFMASNLAAMFGGGKKEVEDPIAKEVMSAELELKQFAMVKKLEKMAGSSSLGGASSDLLEGSEKAFEAKLDKSEDAAAWLLALQTIDGVKLNEKALDKLQLSTSPDNVDLGLAFEGELKNPEQIKGDDIPQVVARWRAENPETKEIPIEVLGIDANPLFVAGYLGWMGLITLGGVVVLIGYTVLKLQGQLPAKGYQQWVTLTGVDARGGRMAIYFATFLGLSVIAGVPEMLGWHVDLVWANAALFLCLIGLAPVFATFPLFGEKVKYREIIGDTSKIWQKLGWGFCGYMANFPLFLVSVALTSPFQKYLPPPSHELLEMINGSGPFDTFLLFFMAAIAAPLIEEPMFRGVLFPALQGAFKSPTAAIVLTGVVFAVIHPQGPLLWPALACIGMTAAILTRQTGSLIPAILMHFLHNATIFGLNTIIK